MLQLTCPLVSWRYTSIKNCKWKTVLTSRFQCRGLQGIALAFVHFAIGSTKINTSWQICTFLLTFPINSNSENIDLYFCENLIVREQHGFMFIQFLFSGVGVKRRSLMCHWQTLNPLLKFGSPFKHTWTWVVPYKTCN